ncbi:MAG: DUF2752 domain-containing protein [Clostridiales bacterium]|nr:DUF2752 domain-containing protein [Clostridiales bacterium]
MSRLLFTQKGNRILAVTAWIVLALLAGMVWLFDLRLTGSLWQCPFRRYMGLDCIGCGSTRALDALLRFQPVEAFRYNPFFCLGLVAGGLWLLCFTRNAFSKKYRPPFSHMPPVWSLYVIGGLLLLFMLIRNLTFYQQWFYV